MDIFKNQKYLHSYFPFGFQISDACWINLNLSSLNESEIPDKHDLFKIRQLAQRYNTAYEMENPISAGELLSARLLEDVLRFIFHYYCFKEYPNTLKSLKDSLISKNNTDFYNKPITSFIKFFPPSVVRNKLKSEKELFESNIFDLPANDILVGELILLDLNNINIALKKFSNFHNDTKIKDTSPYQTFIKVIESFFTHQPRFKPLGMTLIDCLKAPMKDSPDSLDGQLNFIKENWAHILPVELMQQLKIAYGVLKEEQKLRGFGPGKIEALSFDNKAYGYDDGYPEPAMYSIDADWMSNIVIIAKSVHVWLDQLSKKYQRHIKYLNDIPDEELDQLASWGFTGLWLIGLWERSNASQKIKQIMGNPEAASSAYSLYDYVIASDLGGFPAYQNLKQRAAQRGIRLASDMVPNHMGIFSKWIVEHPQWFIQTDQPPYPVYQYTGVNLSDDPNLTIQIEDNYWQHRDAAVVFKRIDHRNGDTRYIYHGNDGTSTPWNDTAQLDFLNKDVREAVIQTILHVAQMFPIIRFDAAMTLAKKHYQRLWFPKDGDEGAIPSRSEKSMSKQDFDSVFPKEFWREVVDRIATEAPDTLLLAEAFWLMEGYFVRTLGMHRVYNSSFMNMLKTEDNLNYRQTIKNVLEFSPQILKRFVNFMNNPDEETAVAQFDKGDKYFGVAMMMVTMPGLPMFGHGQIEGLTEKYGMEYRKAYWDETADQELIRRHEHEIFPLMKKRKLFSSSESFTLFDFATANGTIDENVFAYSNIFDNEKSLILYNNSYNSTEGHIHTSAAFNTAEGEDKNLVQIQLAKALNLKIEPNCFYIFEDHRTKLNYLMASIDFADKGLHLKLNGYQYYAFINFKEIIDHDGNWTKLNQKLNGQGVHDIWHLYNELIFEPILMPFKNLFNQNLFENLTDKSLEVKIRDFINAVISFKNYESTETDLIKTTLQNLNYIPKLLASLKKEKLTGFESVLPTTALYVIINQLEQLSTDLPQSDILKDLYLEHYSQQTLAENYNNNQIAYHDIQLLKILNKDSDIIDLYNQKKFDEIISKQKIADYLFVNKHDNISWFNKEQMDRLNSILLILVILKSDKKQKELIGYFKKINKCSDKSNYDIDKFVKLLIKA